MPGVGLLPGYTAHPDPTTEFLHRSYLEAGMAETGRLVAFYGAGEPMRIEEYEVPEPEPGAIVVRTTLANVCGSDLHVWRGGQDLKKMGRALPRHLGHEQCGEIYALGEGVSVDSAGAKLSLGDRVIFRYAFA